MLDRIEVGRGIAELASPVVTVHDDPFHPVRTLQRLRRLGHVTLEDALADVGRRPGDLSGVAVLDDSTDLERERCHDEVMRRAELLEQRHVAGRPVAETESVADDDTGDVQPVDEHTVDELSRCPRRQLGGEGQDEDIIDPGFGEQRDAMVQRRQHPRLGVRADDSTRVRVERHGDDATANLIRETTRRSR